MFGLRMHSLKLFVIYFTVAWGTKQLVSTPKTIYSICLQRLLCIWTKTIIIIVMSIIEELPQSSLSVHVLCFILHLLSINGSIDQILHFTFESILRFQFTNVKPVSKYKILYHHLIWTFLNNNCRILNMALKPFRKF